MKFMKYILPIVILVSAVLACSPVKPDAPVYEHKGKSVLVYMVANNNLASNAARNLEDMKKGFVPEEDNLLVYYHATSGTPLLLRLYTAESGAVVQDTVYRFPSRNSAEPESLTSTMKVVQTMFPADEYGLFLWSHGTGWLPQGYFSKSFGSDNGVEMELKEMVKAIPYKLSFVAFDACLMGCVEVAYQMKDSVDYIISSPTEIDADGFPYSKVFKHAFSYPVNPEAIAREYYNFYNNRQGNRRNATISVVKTSELDELAAATKVVFDKYREFIPTFDVSTVQPYFRENKHWFYDFDDFITQLAGSADAAPVRQALKKAVTYKASTPYFFELSIDPGKFSGLGTYIPFSPVDPQLDEYYRTLEWNKAVGMVK